MSASPILPLRVVDYFLAVAVSLPDPIESQSQSQAVSVAPSNANSTVTSRRNSLTNNPTTAGETVNATSPDTNANNNTATNDNSKNGSQAKNDEVALSPSGALDRDIQPGQEGPRHPNKPQPVIFTRWPISDHSDAEFPKDSHLFTHPHLTTELTPTPQARQIYSFVLTEADGRRVYGVVLRYWERVGEEIERRVQRVRSRSSSGVGLGGDEESQGQPATKKAAIGDGTSVPTSNGTNAEVTSGPTPALLLRKKSVVPAALANASAQAQTPLYAPKALVLTSHWPFITQLSQALVALHSYTHPASPTIAAPSLPFPIERILTNLIYETPLPPAGQQLVIFHPLQSLTLTFSRPAPNHLPLRDFPLHLLFTWLSPEHVITVFTATLLEKRILFLSSHFDRLTLACESILSLIYPFNWHHVYIPFLPQRLAEFSCAPMPYIMGCPNDYCPDQSLLEGVLIVELDYNNIKWSNSNHSNIITSNHNIGDNNSTSPLKSDEFENLSLPPLRYAALQKSLRKIFGQDLTVPFKLNTNSSINDEELNKIFFNFFVKLLANYRDYIEAPSNKIIEKFQKILFLSNHEENKLGQNFLSNFIDTQMFTVFIDDRYECNTINNGMNTNEKKRDKKNKNNSNESISTSQSNTNNSIRSNLEILLFDESIDEMKGKPAPFLNDTSHDININKSYYVPPPALSEYNENLHNIKRYQYNDFPYLSIENCPKIPNPAPILTETISSHSSSLLPNNMNSNITNSMTALSLKYFNDKRLYSQHFHTLRLRSNKQDIISNEILINNDELARIDEDHLNQIEIINNKLMNKESIQTGTGLDDVWTHYKNYFNEITIIQLETFKFIREESNLPYHLIAINQENQLKLLFSEANSLESKAAKGKQVFERAKSKAALLHTRYLDLRKTLFSNYILTSTNTTNTTTNPTNNPDLTSLLPPSPPLLTATSIPTLVSLKSESEDAALEQDEAEVSFHAIVKEYEERMPEIIKSIRECNKIRMEQFKESMNKKINLQENLLNKMQYELSQLKSSVEKMNVQNDMLLFSEGATDFWMTKGVGVGQPDGEVPVSTAAAVAAATSAAAASTTNEAAATTAAPTSTPNPSTAVEERASATAAAAPPAPATATAPTGSAPDPVATSGPSLSTVDEASKAGSMSTDHRRESNSGSLPSSSRGSPFTSRLSNSSEGENPLSVPTSPVASTHVTPAAPAAAAPATSPPPLHTAATDSQGNSSSNSQAPSVPTLLTVSPPHLSRPITPIKTTNLGLLNVNNPSKEPGSAPLNLKGKDGQTRARALSSTDQPPPPPTATTNPSNQSILVPPSPSHSPSSLKRESSLSRITRTLSHSSSFSLQLPFRKRDHSPSHKQTTTNNISINPNIINSFPSTSTHAHRILSPSTTPASISSLIPSYPLKLWGDSGFDIAINQATQNKRALKEWGNSLDSFSSVLESKSKRYQTILGLMARSLGLGSGQQKIWELFRSRLTILNKSYSDLNLIINQISAEIKLIKGDIKLSIKRYLDHKNKLEKEVFQAQEQVNRARIKKEKNWNNWILLEQSINLSFNSTGTINNNLISTPSASPSNSNSNTIPNIGTGTITANLSNTTTLPNQLQTTGPISQKQLEINSQILEKSYKEYKESENEWYLSIREEIIIKSKLNGSLSRILGLLEKKDLFIGNEIERLFYWLIDSFHLFLIIPIQKNNNILISVLNQVNINNEIKEFIESTYDINTPKDIKLVSNEIPVYQRHLVKDSAFPLALSNLIRTIDSIQRNIELFTNISEIEESDSKLLTKSILIVNSMKNISLQVSFSAYEQLLRQLAEISLEHNNLIKVEFIPILNTLKLNMKESMKKFEKTNAEIEYQYKKILLDKDKASNDEKAAETVYLQWKERVKKTELEDNQMKEQGIKKNIFSSLINTPLESLKLKEINSKNELDKLSNITKEKEILLLNQGKKRKESLNYLLNEMQNIEINRWNTMKLFYSNYIDKFNLDILNKLISTLNSFEDAVKSIDPKLDLQDFLAKNATINKNNNNNLIENIPLEVIEEEVKRQEFAAKEDKEREKRKLRLREKRKLMMSQAQASITASATTNTKGAAGIPTATGTSAGTSTSTSASVNKPTISRRNSGSHTSSSGLTNTNNPNEEKTAASSATGPAGANAATALPPIHPPIHSSQDSISNNNPQFQHSHSLSSSTIDNPNNNSTNSSSGSSSSMSSGSISIPGQSFSPIARLKILPNSVEEGSKNAPPSPASESTESKSDNNNAVASRSQSRIRTSDSGVNAADVSDLPTTASGSTRRPSFTSSSSSPVPASSASTSPHGNNAGDSYLARQISPFNRHRPLPPPPPPPRPTSAMRSASMTMAQLAGITSQLAAGSSTNGTNSPPSSTRSSSTNSTDSSSSSSGTGTGTTGSGTGAFPFPLPDAELGLPLGIGLGRMLVPGVGVGPRIEEETSSGTLTPNTESRGTPTTASNNAQPEH